MANSPWQGIPYVEAFLSTLGSFIRRNDVDVGQQPAINFITGTNISIVATEDTIDEEIDITIAVDDTDAIQFADLILRDVIGDRPAAATEGRLFFASDTRAAYRDNGATWDLLEATPTGSIIQYAAAAAPSGWLLCAGGTVSQATYGALYTLIGTTYGSDAGGNFTLPDLRGRVPVGLGTHVDVDALGDSDGMGTVANRRPKHRHTAHSHTVPLNSSAVGGSNIQGPANTNVTTNTGTADGGSGNANDSLDAPAYLVLNYIIKT